MSWLTRTSLHVNEGLFIDNTVREGVHVKMHVRLLNSTLNTQSTCSEARACGVVLPFCVQTMYMGSATFIRFVRC